MRNKVIVWLVVVIVALLIYQNFRLLSIQTSITDTHALLDGFLPFHNNEKGMAACLLVRDDNALLPEWIAHHYTVLPLSHLVIAADLNSTQNVCEVTSKWQSLVNISVWNSSHFMNRFGPIEVAENDTNHHYLHRQRAFITSCMEHFKRHHQKWVALVDSDEYITINKMPIHNGNDTTRNDTLVKQRKAVMQSTTVLDALNRAEAIAPLSTCHGMPRLLYGALTNVTCNESLSVREYLHQNNFEIPTTIRYVQHATKGAFYPSKWGKVLVNVERLSWESLQIKPKSSHRPFRECSKPLFDFHTCILQVNHYLGSWQRYSSRQDDRRSREAFEERAWLNDGNSCSDRMWEWFPRFVDRVGSVAKARALLQVEP